MRPGTFPYRAVCPMSASVYQTGTWSSFEVHAHKSTRSRISLLQRDKIIDLSGKIRRPSRSKAFRSEGEMYCRIRWAPVTRCGAGGSIFI